jgi:hypothetical protein
MGIRNLTRWIQWIRPLNPMTPMDWQKLRDCRVGIDALSLMYKARAEGCVVLDALATLIRGLRAWGVEPVFVFDGKAPREKEGTRSARRRQKTQVAEPVRVSTDDRNQAKQLFYVLGVLALNAEFEADSVLAYLARRGDLAAVISTDMDFLPRGIAYLIIPNTVADLTTWASVHLAEWLRAADLTYDAFVDMCVLMGCDYAPTLPTVSYQSAYWRIRGGTLLEILASEGIRTPTAWIRAVQILRGEGDRWEDLLSPRQREKWLAGPPPAEPGHLHGLLGLGLGASSSHCTPHNKSQSPSQAHHTDLHPV